MSRRKVTPENKIYAVNLYLEGNVSQGQIAEMYEVTKTSVRQWIRNYESIGAEAFRNKKDSKELKLKAVKDYLDGCGFQDDICKNMGYSQKVNYSAG